MAFLNFNPMAYIKYFSLNFSLNAPMIIAAFAVMASAFNQDIKGLFFLGGAAIIMFMGKFISSSLNRRPPKDTDLAACNLFSSSGWGYEYSAPGPNAVFLSFTAAYMIFGMAVHKNFNWPLLASLLVIMMVNAFFRVRLLRCGGNTDIALGWGFGIIWGVLWYGFVTALQSKAGGSLSLTYFSDESGVNKCKITNKKFKCKKL
jgi:hypothetical protein